MATVGASGGVFATVTALELRAEPSSVPSLGVTLTDTLSPLSKKAPESVDPVSDSVVLATVQV